MKKSDNHSQRMNSNNIGEGSSSASSTSKKPKSKDRKSGEFSGGKPQPNTSVKASYVVCNKFNKKIFKIFSFIKFFKLNSPIL